VSDPRSTGEVAPHVLGAGRTEGLLSFEIKRQQQEVKSADAAHRRQMDAEAAAHRREQEAADNALRRQREQGGFALVVAVTVVMLIAAVLIGLLADDAETRQWARGIVTLILGGIVGVLAGYISGRRGK
jgi:F0F1-type ATP synthase assembly protein I